ncbi:MAG TPA: cyclic nucleotide-binding domain-containing protein [Sandaracinaceae bacterium LLY-WYZ-13_1]|nr:cyclic nucleotide-binding domain-containing protein [Sandaracinaceae bacterium LLY-WYZ-13_1]
MNGEAQASVLDEAWTAWVAGRGDDAIRRCVAILEADAGQIGAASLLTEALAERRADRAADVATRLVEDHVRRGDLPRALAAVSAAAKAGADDAPLRRAIAKAFGRGSERVADVSAAPPPLPPRSVEPIEDGLSGDALDDRAEEALAAYLASERPLEGDVPRLPLFGELPPPALEQLLAAWTVLELEKGGRAIEEGTEGRDAFVVVRGHLRAERGAGEAATVLAELGPGALFGEMALVSEAPRAASVVALEAVQLLCASRDDLEDLAERTPQIGQSLSSFCRARMLSNLVRHSAILRAVDAPERAALMDRFETRSFKRGERLVTHDEETEGLFLLASGAVEVVGRDADGDELRVAELGPGDVVGEISLVLRRPATADVLATHPTVALELRHEQFQEAIREHPKLLAELYDLATKREEEMRSVVAQETLDVEEVVLL